MLRHTSPVVIVLLVALSAAVATIVSARAQSADVLPDGGFEFGGAGWSANAPAVLTVHGSGPVHSGAAAGQLSATASGAMILRTQWWLVSASAGRTYTLTIWLYDDDPSATSVLAALDLTDENGVTRSFLAANLTADAASFQRLVIGPLTAPDGTQHARVIVAAAASAAGATIHIDSAMLAESAPPPTATPAPTVTPTTTPTATTPTATPTATSAATPMSTATATASPVRAATPPAGGSSLSEREVGLANGDFEHETALFGWARHGGSGDVVTGFGRGRSAVLRSETASTKWLHQAVSVDPWRWYEAAAWLLPGAAVDNAFLRVAWYASDDGSGRQLSTFDSPPAEPGGSRVSTGSVRAPAAAHSARVRLVLRPLSEALASLVADDVSWAIAEPPAAAAAGQTLDPVSETPPAAATARAAWLVLVVIATAALGVTAALRLRVALRQALDQR